jgi:hypothetical protein
VSTDNESPSSWRVGGGNWGGGVEDLLGRGEDDREGVLEERTGAGEDDRISRLAFRAVPFARLSRLWMRLVKNPESRLEERT